MSYISKASDFSSGETSPTFGHANANFYVFMDRIGNTYLKKFTMILI